MKPLLLIALAILLPGCSAQVAGMQSPVLHDYGTVDWIPVTQDIEQAFISGPGTSAAVQNDPGTTPEEYQARLAGLPEDARSGELQRIRVGLRLAEGNDMAWNTGSRLRIGYQGAEPLLDVAVDELPRSGDYVEITDLPDVETGEILVLQLSPGDGPDAARLQVGFTPWRAPFGGWRAESNGEEMRGAIVFDTRYERDVDASGILAAAIDRISGSGAPFLVAFGLSVTGLLSSILFVWRLPQGKKSNGR